MILEEAKWVKWTLFVIAVTFLTIVVLFPVIFIFYNAFSEGFAQYLKTISSNTIFSAASLTVFAAVISVVLNLTFGLSISWALGKFSVPGSRLIIAFIELPLALSPVAVGLALILFLGKNSLVGGWLSSYGIDIIYAVPGVVLATMFVTVPYVAREVIPLMQETGNEEEEAAQVLGAGGLRTFFYVTLPNIKWGVIYGILIVTARAIGEFGAVSVVSGHLRGKTDTLTLQVEILYNEYNFTQSFAAASLLTLLAVFTLIIKSLIDWRKSQRGEE